MRKLNAMLTPFARSNDITLRLGSLMLDLGNGDEIHIDNFNRDDVFNSSMVDSFEFAVLIVRSKSEAANDAQLDIKARSASC